MKNCILLLLVFIINIHCGQNSVDHRDVNVEMPTPVVVYTFPGYTALGINLEIDSALSYRQIKAQVKETLDQLSRQQMPLDALGKTFTSLLVNKLIPYWYGTSWSFEGHTAVPGQGEIACGYFVSTTLQDMGVQLNRYQLAQQSPINEARTIAIDSSVLVVEEGTTKANIAYLSKQTQPGIYFIGFDQNHVGYLLNREGYLFLIHSNYQEARGVEIERIEESKVFSSYSRFYLAEISTNAALLKKWLMGDRIEVKKR